MKYPFIYGFPRCPDCGAALGTKNYCLECGLPIGGIDVGINDMAVSNATDRSRVSA